MILGVFLRRLAPTAVQSGVAAVLDVQRNYAAYTSAEGLEYANTYNIWLF
jgi:hypothetical protein